MLSGLSGGKKQCLIFSFAGLKNYTHPQLWKKTKIVQLCLDPFIGNNVCLF